MERGIRQFSFKLSRTKGMENGQRWSSSVTEGEGNFKMHEKHASKNKGTENSAKRLANKELTYKGKLHRIGRESTSSRWDSGREVLDG